jgi:hypothetical protein
MILDIDSAIDSAIDSGIGPSSVLPPLPVVILLIKSLTTG